MKPKGNKCMAAMREQRLLRRAAFWLNAETVKEAKTKTFLHDAWEKTTDF